MYKISAVLAIILSFLPLSGFADHVQGWEDYQKKFIAADGRVIDFFQGSMSHSEGQGYGLLLALMNGDRDTFDRVMKWSVDNLQVRRDALFAWAWGKRHNDSWAVIDYNNASDGDVLIALALLKAARRWNHEPYLALAKNIIKDLRTLLAYHQNDYAMLLPGYYGFEEKAVVILNTGYLIFPAFSRFAAVDDAKFWSAIYNDSLKILTKARFSRFQLPSDWIRMDNGDVSVFTQKSSYFGYEAIRIPLYMTWDDNRDQLKSFSSYLQFVTKSNYLPNRVNLVDGSASVDEAPAGFYAVFGRCAELLEKKELSQKLLKEANHKLSGESNDYFSHTLYLLSKLKLD
jgi:endoglucanase